MKKVGVGVENHFMFNLYDYFSLPKKAYLTPEEIEEQYIAVLRKYKDQNLDYQINEAFMRISEPVTRLDDLFEIHDMRIAEVPSSQERLARILSLQEEMEFMSYEELEHYYHVVRNQINELLRDIDSFLGVRNFDKAHEAAIEVRYLSRFTDILGMRIDELSL